MDLPLLAILAAAMLVVAGLAAVLVVTVSGRRRLQSELDDARADVDALRSRVEALARRDDQPELQEFVITSLDEEPVAGRGPTGASTTVPLPDGDGAALPAGQFVTVALSESAVRLVSLGYGVRRALSPANRNRIRFEMRREVKRARRQRRRDLKEAKRHIRAGQGSDLAEDAA